MSRRWQNTTGLLLLTVIWLGGLAERQAVAAPAPMRAVILFDNSGSMRQNDPHRLSQMAAQLFLDLTRPEDRVGLVAFSDTGVPLLPLTEVSSLQAKAPFLTALRALRFDGQTTDLSAALKVGLSSFSGPPAENGRDLVLLLTDGKLDLGRQRRAAEPLALEYIRQTLLPRYLERGIALYTIAFTEAADRALLQDMAQATAGEFRFIQSPSMLHKAFGELFVVAKQAESIPMQDGAVLLDASIQQASLVLSKSNAQESISLVTPQHQRLDANSTHPGVSWNSTPSYDVVQLTKPEPGTWQVERPSGGGNDIAIIGTSTLSLQVDLAPTYLEAGESFTIRARLLEQEQPLRDAQQWQGLTVQAEITTPEGQLSTVPLQPHGVGEFAATLPIPQASGQYRLLVIASSPTFKRQRTLSFIPQPLCFEPAVVADPPVTAQVTLTDHCPVFSTLEIGATYVPGDDARPAATTWLPLTSPRPRVFLVTLPRPPSGQERHVSIRIHGRLKNAQPITIMKGPLPLPELPPPEMDWGALAKTVGFQLLMVNAILGVVGGSGYGMYRYRAPNRRESHG